MTPLICQICDYAAEIRRTNPKDMIEEWCVHTIKFNNVPLRILACPTCSNSLNLDEIFEGYKLRIREGRDGGYH